MRRFLALVFPLLLAFLLVSRAAEWASEKWWFEALDQSATWWSYMQWRALAFVVAAPLWLTILGLNLRLAWRQALALREPLSLLGGQMAGVALQISPALRVGRSVARAMVWTTAWLAGLAAANRFDLWLLLRQSSAAASDEGNLSFFLFQLPALEWISSYLGLLFGLTFVGCLLMYFWLEAIETGPGVLRASESARQHLSLLGALLIAWKGADCALNVLSAPVVFGNSVNGILGVPEQLAGLPANQLFAWSALPVAAAIFALGARARGRDALVLSSMWLALATLAPALAPAIARSVGVGNDAAQAQLIAAHLQSTRQAWGFDNLENVSVQSDADFAETALPAPSRPSPVALWPMGGAISALDDRLARESAPPLRAARLHVARAGDELQLRAIVTRRDLPTEAPARQLQAPANQAGPLRFDAGLTLDTVLLSEAAPTPEPPTNRLGPAPTGDAAPFEPLPRYRQTAQSRFAIERSFLGACLTLAWRFLDPSLAAPGPPLMWHLDPVERAQTLAPFVNWSGAIAHPVVLESGVGPHVYWIVEGCLTARTHPNSATLPGGDNWAGINYARQNVTAVFDASTGESELYLFNRTEPLSRAWSRALPALFRPIEEMAPPLRAAIRPSPAYLSAMSRIYPRYHRASGDETLAWATRESEWRPILAQSDAPAPFWNDALLPGYAASTSSLAAPKRALAQWQIATFAPARGRVETGDSVAALTAIAGVTIDESGVWRWRQWRAPAPLKLPAFATPPQYTYNVETGARFAPPSRVGVFPNFDEAGRADGFTAFRAEIRPAPSDGAGAPPTLQVQAATTGALAATASANAPLSTSLARVRDLWSAILQARRQSDWAGVARLEAQLGRALGTPDAQPTPTATVEPPATTRPTTPTSARPDGATVGAPKGPGE